jgi:hypothetical protein
MAFKLIHNIVSKLADTNGINNFPGVDKTPDNNLSYNFITNNIRSLHENCINLILADFPDLIIASAYRCKKLNKLLGGTENSQHVYGYAADIITPNHPSSLLWNWCYQNLPRWNQLIWEYPERGNYNGGATPKCSWVHISYIEGDNTKKTSLGSNREDLHEMYAGELQTRKGKYTHTISLADENYL